MSATLVLVSGSGRSGTSSLAGSLKRLGLHIPQPEVEASETNPRGFYEPRWVMDFHKGHLRDLAVFNIDSRPSAVDVVADLVATGRLQEELRAWLVGQLEHPQLVVKDPHAFWFGQVWQEVCDDLGVDLKWLTALRHPAEVVGSRDLAYRKAEQAGVRRIKETSNVAGWVHATLLTEQVGRPRAGDAGRAFIRYPDLLADWRTALGRVEQQLGLEFNTDLSGDDPHAVDDFIEPTMRRSHLVWDDLTLPTWLRDSGQEVWDLLDRLVTDPADGGACVALDRIHADYVARYEESLSLVFDHTEAESTRAARRVREKQGARVEILQRRLRETRAELAAARGSHGVRDLVARAVRRARALRR